MSSLQAFFAQNVKVELIEEVVISERFKDESGNPIPWKIKSITEEENEEIRKASMNYVKVKGGQRIPELKMEEYLAKVAVASVVFPNLRDAELQKSYGVVGAESLLKKMLLPGEYADLIQKVQEINGFSANVAELMDEVKN